MSKLQKKVYISSQAAWYLEQMQTVTGKTQSQIVEELVIEADVKRSVDISPEIAWYLEKIQGVTGKSTKQTLDDLVFAEAENQNLRDKSED